VTVSRFVLAALILSGCYNDCKHENRFPSKEFDCTINELSEDAIAFLFLSDSTLEFKRISVVTYKDEIAVEDLIFFNQMENPLGSYKVVEINDNYLLIETFRPTGPRVSWKPETQRYRMKICQESLRIFRDDDRDLANEKSIVFFSTILV